MEKFSKGDIDYSKGNKIVRWFKNYWYYYKWIVIGLAFAIIVVSVCSYQTCSNVKEDLTIMYAGPFPSADISVENMQEALSYILPKDYNDNGSKDVSLAMMSVYSEEQIKNIEKNPDSNMGIRIDRTMNKSEFDKFQNLALASDYYLCMLDPWLFDILKEGDRLLTLKDVLGYTPDYAVNDYAVRLSDTQFGQYFKGIDALPKETYICIKTPSEIKGGKENDAFVHAKDTLKAILDYRYPQDFDPNKKQ